MLGTQAWQGSRGSLAHRGGDGTSIRGGRAGSAGAPGGRLAGDRQRCGGRHCWRVAPGKAPRWSRDAPADLHTGRCPCCSRRHTPYTGRGPSPCSPRRWGHILQRGAGGDDMRASSCGSCARGGGGPVAARAGVPVLRGVAPVPPAAHCLRSCDASGAHCASVEHGYRMPRGREPHGLLLGEEGAPAPGRAAHSETDAGKARSSLKSSTYRALQVCNRKTCMAETVNRVG